MASLTRASLPTTPTTTIGGNDHKIAKPPQQQKNDEGGATTENDECPMARSITDEYNDYPLMPRSSIVRWCVPCLQQSHHSWCLLHPVPFGMSFMALD
jgi:hypothetical protein